MISVNEINIAKLPEDDVPESIWTTIERIENSIDEDAERRGYIVDPLSCPTGQDEANAASICPMNTR